MNGLQGKGYDLQLEKMTSNVPFKSDPEDILGLNQPTEWSPFLSTVHPSQITESGPLGRAPSQGWSC